VHPHIRIPFSNPYFSNPVLFSPKNIETKVEIGFFRPFSSLPTYHVTTCSLEIINQIIQPASSVFLSKKNQSKKTSQQYFQPARSVQTNMLVVGEAACMQHYSLSPARTHGHIYQMMYVRTSFIIYTPIIIYCMFACTLIIGCSFGACMYDACYSN
jgi:hypothetical protein